MQTTLVSRGWVTLAPGLSYIPLEGLPWEVT